MTAASVHRSLIVGTAGHIDHGKSALIRLLTGIDTDRLKEEKERGISIELGFASLELPSGRRVGIVDVPGHERFVRNMLAGAGGIDLILFVIAADEGVMPQTREHMDIIDLLGVEHGVVALTKIDLVDADFRELVEETVKDYLATTCLRNAPVVGVSATTGAGREAIIQALDQVARTVAVAERGHIVRLPIDRVFTMEGFGTVVTGTLWAGRLCEGDPARIVPRGLATRIKSLEVHNQRVREAVAGQRVAVALHAVDKMAIARGDWLVAGSEGAETAFVDARVRVLRDAAKPIESGQRMRFHLGAAEVIGRIVLLEGDELAPGKDGWAQLRLEQPVLTERGDRFVLRTYSPMHTVAGGIVVTAGVGRRRRFRNDDISALDQAEKGTPAERVAAATERHGGRAVDGATLARETGCPPSELTAALAQLTGAGQLIEIGKRVYVAATAFERAGEELRDIILDYQRRAPLSYGLSKSELKKRVEISIHPEAVELWVRRASERGVLFARGDRLRWGDAQVVLSPAHGALRKDILAQVAAAGFDGLRIRELQERVARAGGEAANTRDVDALVGLLVDSGEIVRVPPDFYFDSRRIEESIARVRQFFATSPELRIGDLKDLIGVTRKQAVPLLEYLDQMRFTLRRGDARLPGPRLRPADGAAADGRGGADGTANAARPPA